MASRKGTLFDLKNNYSKGQLFLKRQITYISRSGYTLSVSYKFIKSSAT